MNRADLTPPIPDPHINSHYQNALQDYRIGLRACLHAAGPPVVNGVETVELGNAELEQADNKLFADLPGWQGPAA